MTRRYDLDWLRVFAIITIFLFHCACFFSEAHWQVKNVRISFGMTVAVSVVSQWIMPLFFILSAFSTRYALDIRSNGQFIAERFYRLVVPLIFGIFALIPPQVYLERVSHQQFTGSFFSFLPHYFDGLYGFGGNFAWMGLHLWYLEMLFVFSLLCLPLFRYFMKPPASGFIGIFSRPGGLFLFVIPIALMELFVNLYPQGVGRHDFGGWSPLTYLVFFVAGYLLACDPRIGATIERHRVGMLAIGIAATVAGYFLLTSGYSDSASLFSLLRSLNSWAWLLAILGFGSRYFKSGSRFLNYAGLAVLPFYILHQTVLVIIAFYIIDWEAGIVIKYLFLAAVSFIVILASYDLLVRRIGMLRFLFGMKNG